MRLVAGWSSETDLKKDELKFKNLKNPPFEIKKSINYTKFINLEIHLFKAWRRQLWWILVLGKMKLT